MLIKWGDLVPGDVLKYNPDFIDDINKSIDLLASEKEYFNFARDKNLIVFRVKPNIFYPNRFGVEVKIKDTPDEYGFWWNIDENTGLLWKNTFYNVSESPVFTIVELTDMKEE